MVDCPKSGRLGRSLALWLTLMVLPWVYAASPAPLSLEEVNRRSAPDLTAVHENEKVVVRGVVSAPAYHFPLYSILALQTRTSGITLKAMSPDGRLEPYHPGDEIEAHGTVNVYAGAISIVPDTIVLLARKAPPLPIEIASSDLTNFKYMGLLVHTRGHVRQLSDTTAGGLLTTESQLRVFIPRPHPQPTPGFGSYRVGDDISVTGVLFQYCPRTPFNTGFEVLAHDTSEVARTENPWSISPMLLAAGLTVVLLVAFVLWSRERRLRNQRERLRRTFQLGEEILGAGSSSAILKRICEALPGILEISNVRLYVYNRAGKTLDSVVEDPNEPVSISLSSPPPGTQAGAVACFHYRTLLVIPDIERSPFPIAGKQGEASPKSLLFVPMLAQGEVTGVLELDQDDRPRDFTADEQALAQHLGNQIGVAIRLLDQRSVQEQLFRTEKLAAVGRLISGVVNELQAPLRSISDLATRTVEKSRMGVDERELTAIAAESQKASAIVARLVSFAAAEQGEARPVSISQLLRSLIEFREGDWKASGIRVRNLTAREPLYVLGSQGQLEQVFLNLLVHAEQSLAQAAQKMITVRTSVLAKRLLVEIAFTAPLELRKPEETAAVLGVTRSVVAGHGGEVRLIDKTNADPRFEVELPISARERVSASSAANGPSMEVSRRMTALIIEPDDAAQRQIVAMLSSRGFRVVPVGNSDNGLELAHRMRFDAAFCSVHAPGLNWVELSERMHSRVGGFILLSDGYDAELSADFEGDGRFVLAKPVQEPELERVLRTIDRLTTAKVVPIKNGVA